MEEDLPAGRPIPRPPRCSGTEPYPLVFHGTSLTRAGEIIWSETLKASAAPTWPDDGLCPKLRTIRGYVYVTTQLSMALRYADHAVCLQGNKLDPSAQMGLNGRVGTVFACRVDCRLLLPDPTDNSIDKRYPEGSDRGSRRVQGDLTLKDACFCIVNLRRSGGLDVDNYKDLTWYPVRLGSDDLLSL